MAKSPEHNLIQGCLKGDKRAQKELYQTYKSSMYGICLRYAKNREEAKDMLQDGFVKIYSNLYQYKPIGPLGGWMRRVMVNVCLQHIRRRKDLFSNTDIDKVAHLYQAQEEVFTQFREKALVQMIQQLPEGYRAVFNLYVIEGYSHKEIAQQLGISESTSKSQLSRAKATLRQLLEKQIL